MLKVIQASIHTTNCLTFNEKNDDATSMEVPFLLVWIGYEVFWSIVCNTMLLTTSQVDVHSVLYLSLLRLFFKRPKFDSTPSVHISVLYPMSRGSEDLFSAWMGITKLLDPVIKPFDADEVDYNGSDSELGHRVVEDVIKPTMKTKCILVVNVWGSGNITEVELVSFNPSLLASLSASNRYSSL